MVGKRVRVRQMSDHADSDELPVVMGGLPVTSVHVAGVFGMVERDLLRSRVGNCVWVIRIVLHVCCRE